jgi:hypothetical protein
MAWYKMQHSQLPYLERSEASEPVCFIEFMNLYQYRLGHKMYIFSCAVAVDPTKVASS